MTNLSWVSKLANPITVSLAVTMIFSIRFLACLPFSDATRVFNPETITTLTSFLIYAQEPWSFPLGAIRGLTFPFSDANIGNVGAIPLFALAFKALGTLVPYFQTFDYFVLVEIASCFFTALFAQSILLSLGVHHAGFRSLGALLTGSAFLLLTRSEWLQPFCVVAFPLFAAWIDSMLLVLQRGGWKIRQDLVILSIYPLAALVDNYSLFGILLGTSVLLVREVLEGFFGNHRASWNRGLRILCICIFGSALAILALYLIGMYPLPPVPRTFTSYDFGMGGRFHGADLLSPWMAVANTRVSVFPEPSLLGRLNFPISTDLFVAGQYEGVAYVGTAVLALWVFIAARWLLSMRKRFANDLHAEVSTHSRLPIYAPWKKVGVACCLVFVFSLGYELHILGHAFPDFSGMPAAWIADRLPSVYNIRATGRLAPLLSLFLILEAVRQLNVWYVRGATTDPSWTSGRGRRLVTGVIAALVVIHLVEIAPLLRPIPAQPSVPIGGIYTEAEIAAAKSLGSKHDVVLIAPSVRAVETKWTTEAFSLAYYLGLRSNLYYLARTDPQHDVRIATDLDRIVRGEWDLLAKEYGDKVLFAIPISRAESLRSRMSDRYQETQIGAVSLWAKRHGKN